ncbi:het domain-containing protein [Fusarium flagelliforme]|uniref:Het domain-containing protein n=2 Tax=Fusarium flagelliforme TaxID=2675880 RepID=A0A395N3J4_9HYPO|nr:het domain-containing protein [Fusarium flagelliforme]
MATIYNNAYLVLAALQAANSKNGFLDRKDESFSETPQLDAKNSLKIAKLRNPNGTVSHIYCRKRNSEPLHQHRFKVEEAPLNRRGWVLQENTLSRRIVHFTNSEILWECIECLKCECMEIEDDDLEENSQITAGMVRNAQFTRTKAYDAPEDLHERWLHLISRYKGLVLTHDSDRLPALSGLARLWQSRGAGQYLAGIWRDHIPESLLWIKEKNTECKTWDGYMAPSWSPFSLGYIDGNTSVRRLAFVFGDPYRYTMTERAAHVVDAQCSLVGNDPMGAVNDGFITLKGPIGTVLVEGDTPFYVNNPILQPYQGHSPLHPGIWGLADWDCPEESVFQRDVSLILLGYSGKYVKHLIAMVLMPLETVPGTYRRIGLLSSPRDDLRKFLEGAEERVVKIR